MSTRPLAAGRVARCRSRRRLMMVAPSLEPRLAVVDELVAPAGGARARVAQLASAHERDDLRLLRKPETSKRSSEAEASAEPSEQVNNAESPAASVPSRCVRSNGRHCSSDPPTRAIRPRRAILRVRVKKKTTSSFLAPHGNAPPPSSPSHPPRRPAAGRSSAVLAGRHSRSTSRHPAAVLAFPIRRDAPLHAAPPPSSPATIPGRYRTAPPQSSPSPSACRHSVVLSGRILLPLRSSSVSRFSGRPAPSATGPASLASATSSTTRDRTTTAPATAASPAAARAYTDSFASSSCSTSSASSSGASRESLVARWRLMIGLHLRQSPPK
uniref:Uncharacterized protein n=1 Tax=Oryza meridionalis TaxID=40149 RepID=A0A0E0CFW0_9ORYZ